MILLIDIFSNKEAKNNKILLNIFFAPSQRDSLNFLNYLTFDKISYEIIA